MKDGNGNGRLWTGVIVIASLALGALAGWFARDFFAVNACLEMGGAWTAPGVCVGVPAR
jgi:hypothetical protein